MGCTGALASPSSSNPVKAYGRILSTQGFLSGAVVKNPPANVGDTGSIPESGRSPEEGNGILARRIPWTEEPGGLQSMGSQETQTQLSD